MFCLVIIYLLTYMSPSARARNGRDNDLTPKLRHVVASLQEQILELKQEQQRNRDIIKTLEVKINGQVLQEGTAYEKFDAAKNFEMPHRATMDMLQMEPDVSLPQSSRVRRRKKDGNKNERRSGQSEIPEPLRDLSLVENIPNRTEQTNDNGIDAKIIFLQSDKNAQAFNQWAGIMKSSSDPNILQTVDHGIPELRNEWEELKAEVRALQQELEVQKKKYEHQNSHLSELRSGHATTSWIQRTVDEVKKEISELASTINTSMILWQSQHFEGLIDHVKTDMLLLKNEVDHGEDQLHKQMVEVLQVKEDMQRVKEVVMDTSNKYQQIESEIVLLKEELLKPAELRTAAKSGQDTATAGTLIESDGSGSGDATFEPYLFFNANEAGSGDALRPDYGSAVGKPIQQELFYIKKGVNLLRKNHLLVERQLRVLKQSYGLTSSKVEVIESRLDQLSNDTRSYYKEHSNLSKNMTDIKTKLYITERNVERNRGRIVNITETATGIDKIHMSTKQLFEAIDSLEDDYTNGMGELQKVVSKFEFNVAQVQGSFDILRLDQASHYEELKVLKGEVSGIQRDHGKDRMRLVDLQNDLLNRSLTYCAHETKEAEQERKLVTLELELRKLEEKSSNSRVELNLLNNKVNQKMDKHSINALESSQRSVLGNVVNISTQLANFVGMQSELKKKLLVFVKMLPNDCSMDNVPSKALKYIDGTYLIGIGDSPKEVFCDMTTEGEKWTVIQRRRDGSEDFFRNWKDYKEGFGIVSGEFWFGNDAIYKLTNTRTYILRIDMWDVFDRYIYAEYQNFRIGSEDEMYKLEIGTYSGNATDSLKHHKNMAFSTHDRDNDASSTHCAMFYTAGWWYEHCQYANVNGRYALGMTWYDSGSNTWIHLEKVEMKIRVQEVF